MNTLHILSIGLGGFVGSVARYAIGYLIDSRGDGSFPYGILVVNLVGCLLFGLMSGVVESREMFTEEVRALIFIGLLGSFTTFSTFSSDSLKMLSEGDFLGGFLNIGLSLVLGLVFIWLGYLISTKI